MNAIVKQDAPATAEAPAISDDLLARIIGETEKVVSRQSSRPSPVKMRTWEEIERFAVKAARSGMVPKDYIGKPDAICIAVQMGSELGLPPMQALQNIAVINGRPSIWGDAMPALCRASGMCRTIREWSEGTGDGRVFFCEAVRKDDPNPVLRRFGVAEAKQAGLWGKPGPWQQYPDRMLQMRARGFALRDAFPDVLRGLIAAEEAMDIPSAEATGLTPTKHEEPRDTGEAIGDRLPDHSAPHPLDERLPSKWLINLERLLKGAVTRAEVEAIAAHPRVETALQKMRPDGVLAINDLLADAFARFPEQEERADEPLLPEVEIAGEEKVFAG